MAEYHQNNGTSALMDTVPVLPTATTTVAVTRAEVMAIRDLVIQDAVALEKWSRVIDRIVDLPLDAHALKRRLDDRDPNYAEIVLRSLELWEARGTQGADLLKVLEMIGLNTLMEKDEDEYAQHPREVVAANRERARKLYQKLLSSYRNNFRAGVNDTGQTFLQPWSLYALHIKLKKDACDEYASHDFDHRTHYRVFRCYQELLEKEIENWYFEYKRKVNDKLREEAHAKQSTPTSGNGNAKEAAMHEDNLGLRADSDWNNNNAVISPEEEEYLNAATSAFTAHLVRWADEQQTHTQTQATSTSDEFGQLSLDEFDKAAQEAKKIASALLREKRASLQSKNSSSFDFDLNTEVFTELHVRLLALRKAERDKLECGFRSASVLRAQAQEQKQQHETETRQKQKETAEAAERLKTLRRQTDNSLANAIVELSDRLLAIDLQICTDSLLSSYALEKEVDRILQLVTEEFRKSVETNDSHRDPSFLQPYIDRLRQEADRCRESQLTALAKVEKAEQARLDRDRELDRLQRQRDATERAMVDELFSRYSTQLNQIQAKMRAQPDKAALDRLQVTNAEFRDGCHKLLAEIPHTSQKDRVNTTLQEIQRDMDEGIQKMRALLAAEEDAEAEEKPPPLPKTPPPSRPSSVSEQSATDKGWIFSFAHESSKPIQSAASAASAAQAAARLKSLKVSGSKSKDPHPQAKTPPTPPSPPPPTNSPHVFSGKSTASAEPEPQPQLLVVHIGRGRTIQYTTVSRFQEPRRPERLAAYLAFAPDGECVIGDAARVLEERAVSLQQVHAGRARFPVRVKGDEFVRMRYEEILALFLAKCKQQAEGDAEAEGRADASPITDLLVVIPAMSSSVQCGAISDSALLAGFTHLRLVSQLTAAAFHYFHEAFLSHHRHRHAQPEKETLLVSYFGADAVGGSADEFAIYRLSPGPASPSKASVVMEAISGARTGCEAHQSASSAFAFALTQGLVPVDVSSSDEKCVRDLMKQACIESHGDISRVLVASDVDSKRAGSKLLLGGGFGRKQYHLGETPSDEVLMQGAHELASLYCGHGQLSSSGSNKLWSCLLRECIPGEIQLRLVRPASASEGVETLVLFKHNSPLPLSVQKPLNFAYKAGSLQFQINDSRLKDQLGLAMCLGCYTAKLPLPPSIPVTGEFELDSKGILGVRLTQGGRECELERTDKLNLGAPDSHSFAACQQAVTGFLHLKGGKPLEIEHVQTQNTKNELQDYLVHLEAAVEARRLGHKPDNDGDGGEEDGGGKAQIEHFEGIIASTRKMIKDPRSELKVLSSQLELLLKTITNL